MDVQIMLPITLKWCLEHEKLISACYPVGPKSAGAYEFKEIATFEMN